jgi:hypothetical protein
MFVMFRSTSYWILNNFDNENSTKFKNFLKCKLECALLSRFYSHLKQLHNHRHILTNSTHHISLFINEGTHLWVNFIRLVYINIGLNVGIPFSVSFLEIKKCVQT